VDQRLIHRTILSFECYEISRHTQEQFETEAIDKDALVNFCKVVSELDGMEEGITFNRYEIQMSKASDMFSWDNIMPYVLDALRTFVARDNKLEESAPSKRPTAEYLKSLRKQGCEV
jgi:hypothetical protein